MLATFQWDTSFTDNLDDIRRRWKEIFLIECLKLAVRAVMVASPEDHMLNES